MVTRLYFHAATSPLSNLPTTEQSSLTADKNVDAQSVNRTMDGVLNVATASQQSLVLTSNATVSLQRYYFTRFVSQALTGISSITAQTWKYNFSFEGSSTSSNYPVSSSGVVRVMAYVWRPSTQTKVGDILDGNTTTLATEASASAQRSSAHTFTGSSVASIQDGDVICFEVWFENTQAAATAFTDTYYFDGTTITETNNSTVTNHASFIETPQDLTFNSGRLFFHSTTNPLTNLPTTKQGSLTSNKDVDAQSVNRTMNKTIGTSQTSLVLTSNTTLSAQNYYFTRFVSESLSGITSITAGPWNYNISALENSTNANFPTGASSIVRITLYVWRPSTQTKVGDILDGNSNADADEATTSGTGRVSLATFSGSSVAGVQNGDVICFEVWFQITQSAATAYTDSFFYDGTTVNITRLAATTNHASYIETSQVLVFGAPAGPVDCTVTGKTIYNKTTRHA